MKLSLNGRDRPIGFRSVIDLSVANRAHNLKFRMQAKVSSRQEKRRKEGTEIFFGGVRDSRGDLMRKGEKRERGAKARSYIHF